MKTETSTDGAYINEALKCSSLNISNPKEDEPHGGLKGSNEYICKYEFILLGSSLFRH